jgi:hypothetical protein
VCRSSGQFGTLAPERHAVREGTCPSLIAAGLGNRSWVVSSVIVPSNVHTPQGGARSARAPGGGDLCTEPRLAGGWDPFRVPARDQPQNYFTMPSTRT